MPNRLASESSPYLLQHAENPVEWYPWSEEALAKARAENKPIFLSIGYSACHWCHVMEHESFENDTIARFLNENFVAIKVDREERPDLDQIYMQAVMALQRGQGGWPLSAFLTPDGNVFFGGTYWPPQDSRGMPGFDRVLRGVLQAFQTQRDQVEEQSGKVTEYLRSINVAGSSDHTLEFDRQTLLDVGESLQRIFDFQNGGFGRAPKFPHAMDLQVLMRLQYYDATAKPNDTTEQARELPWLKMVNLNLEKMALGGIYDHLGGGFARYSVDEHWLVPHFEKMLYDNALLSDAYLDAYTLSGNELFRQRAVETFDYQLRYMTDPAGGFHSTEDADSEGVEGKFYVWSRQEIMDVLGDADGETFCHVYNVTAGGNFEGRNILNLSRPLEHLAELRDYDSDLPALMAKCRDRLLAVRDQRIRPGKDDKILVSWNAMMIHSLAKGGRILNNADYFQAAVNAARFIECEMRQQDGVGLFHTWRHGKAKFSAFLDDYACLINALMTLFECSGDLSWLRWAKELTDHVIDEFLDSTGAGFFFTSRSSEKLIARTKDIQDSSVPSGNGMMVCALNRLYRLTEKQHYRELAESTAALGQELLKKAPSAAGQMVSGMDQLTSVGQEIVIFAHENQSDAILESIHSVFHPNRIVCPVLDSPSTEPLAMSLLAGKQMLQNQPTVYICENYACQSPLTGMKSIKEFFEERK